LRAEIDDQNAVVLGLRLSRRVVARLIGRCPWRFVDHGEWL
jgi:hypothetical protein